MFLPSKQQSTIFANISGGEGHSVVLARAGTGKTTTIVQGFDYVPPQAARGGVAMFAFNKSIATELQARAPQGVQVQTLHSYGLRSLGAALGFRPSIDVDKVKSIVEPKIRAMPLTKEEKSQLSADLRKAVSLAKGCLAHDVESVGDVCDQFEISPIEGNGPDREEFLSMVVEILGECRENQRVIDFDDMVWMPAIFGIRPQRFARVFVDETQDLNACQIKLSLKALEASGRILAVGDDRQAIYGFRGAADGAVDQVVAKLDARVLPLNVTYRCAQRIVEEARQIVPDFYAAPGAPLGVVAPSGMANMIKNASPGDFILSRTNAPLVSLCFAFLREGRRVAIQGRDIGAKLRGVVTRTKETEVSKMLAKVDAWAEREVKRLVEADKDPSQIQDTAECVHAVSENCDSVGEVLGKIEGLFSDDGAGSAGGGTRVMLSSTHKAKGLERERVWLLRDTYLKGRRVARGDGGFDYTPPSQEEENLFYVAVTRAKSELYMVRKD